MAQEPTENRVGVVIQGPMTSVGRTGATSVIRFSDVKPEDIVTYDCRPNVADLVDRFADALHHIVCVTWDDEHPGDLAERIGPGRLVQIADTTRTVSAKGRVIPGNNKYRQFLSTLAGLDRLKAAGCTHAIKIRTDQSLDIVSLRDRVLADSVDAYTEDRILFPGCRRKMPAHLPDFYFGGRLDTLIDLCQFYLEEEEFHDIVHFDFFFKSAWRRRRETDGSPLWAYKPRGFYTRQQKAVIRSAWWACYGTFPQEVFESVTWRGEAFPASFVSRHLYAATSVEERDGIIDGEVEVSPWRNFRSRIKHSIWLPAKAAMSRFRGRHA